MKKIILSLILLFCFSVFAQDEREFNIGLNFGLSTGEAKEFSSSGIGVTANYLFDDFFEYFKVGPSTGFVYFFSEDTSKTSADMFIPVAATVQFNEINDKFYVAVDAGYAMAISGKEDNSSGIFFKPAAGYLFNDALKVNLFYAGIRSKVTTTSYVGIGVSYDILASGSSFGSF